VVIGSNNFETDVINHGTYSIQPMTKIGIIVLIAVFAVIVLITGMFIMHAEPSERRLINAIAASPPFLLIRIIYVVLITFPHIRSFSILYGSVASLGCKAVMQEMIAFMIYIGIGITLPRKIKDTSSDGEKVGEGSNETGGWIRDVHGFP
jgi:hypothetical protein